MRKRISVMLLVVLVVIAATMPAVAFAKGGRQQQRIYKDVTTSKVDKDSYDAIVFIAQHNGWYGLIRRGRLYPNQYMTRREFFTVLCNLYGNIVPAICEDVVLANSITTSDYCCKKMAALSVALGYEITWDGYNDRMRRKDVARYIKKFAYFNPSLMPRR